MKHFNVHDDQNISLVKPPNIRDISIVKCPNISNIKKVPPSPYLLVFEIINTYVCSTVRRKVIFMEAPIKADSKNNALTNILLHSTSWRSKCTNTCHFLRNCETGQGPLRSCISSWYSNRCQSRSLVQPIVLQCKHMYSSCENFLILCIAISEIAKIF